VSKLVSSGTSSKSDDAGIDKGNIYSSDDGTRHLEKVQETQTNGKKVNDKKATTCIAPTIVSTVNSTNTSEGGTATSHIFPITMMTNLGIPLTSSMATGFAIGVMKG
jgi:hypothetical protein